MPPQPSRRPNPRRPTRRSFEKFSQDPLFKQNSNWIERIGFMADPKEWLIPTSERKSRNIGEFVDEMRMRGLVQVGYKNGIFTVAPTSLAKGLHFITRYCLSAQPFVKFSRDIQYALVRMYLVTLIRQHDYKPATQKYDSTQPIQQREIFDRIKHDADITRLERKFRPFGNPAKWDPLTRQYYHFLAQKAAIAQAADEFLTQKRWAMLMELRANRKLSKGLPKYPWGKKNESN